MSAVIILSKSIKLPTNQPIGLLTIGKYLNGKGLNPTRQTLINWCKEYGVGKKIGGKWFMKKSEIDGIISGKISKPFSGVNSRVKRGYPALKK